MPLLGSFTFAGLTTLLTTAATVGGINAAPALYTVQSGIASTNPPDVAHFQPSFLGQAPDAALGAGIGHGGCTLQPLLLTRTGSTAIWANPNTTAVPGDMTVKYFHSIVR